MHSIAGRTGIDRLGGNGAKLCEHAGVNVDYSNHAEIFGEAADVHRIARELDEKLPTQ
jgi:hypothetical protein